MILKSHLKSVAVAVLLLFSALSASAGAEVLATVGSLSVTSDQLETAIASSPFNVQFAAMDEDDQAALRGDLLKRLVIQRLLYLEAERLGLDKTPEFTKELESFRLGLLYRHYMDRLREQITIPPEDLAVLKDRHKGDPDGLTAAKSAYVVDRYRAVRLLTLQTLREKRGVKVYKERITPETAKDTLLLEGEGIRITYGDILEGTRDLPEAPSPEWSPDQIEEKLYKRAEFLLIAQAAEAEGVDVGDRVASYRSERLPALLLQRMEAQWIPGEEVLQEYFQAHPELGRVLERRHIGQLVAATRDEAEALRERILAGESLFALAGEQSIDPYGRERNGDMGWVVEGRGMPEIEQAIAQLRNDEISAVVETPRGFHLVTILERRPGGQRPFDSVRDKVRQEVIAQKSAPYFQDLERRYGVKWNVIQAQHAGLNQ
ncbi:MAG: peptidylprolyl isomerase [Chromatiaceae bacterium]|nr:peptidylprolyl isomerase [Chromatiaceae bacterium]